MFKNNFTFGLSIVTSSVLVLSGCTPTDDPAATPTPTATPTETPTPAPRVATLTRLASYNTGLRGGSEIVQFCKDRNMTVVTNVVQNKIDLIDITNPSNLVVTDINMSSYGNGIQSVAVKGKIAVAVDVKTNDYYTNFVTLKGWEAISLASNKNWYATNYQGKPYAYINGFGSTNSEASNDWLVSPKMTFGGTRVLSFENATRYTGGDFKLKISTDYNGSVSTATWTEIPFTKSTGNYVFVNSGDLDLSAYTGQVNIAFHYTSTSGATNEAAGWEITNLRVTNQNTDAHDNGKVVIFNNNGTLLHEVKVGALPDMVTFTDDGSKIIVANEGEPNDAYSVDPMGTIGIITVADGSYKELNFLTQSLTNATDGTAVRLGATPSNAKGQDIEPEYIAVKGNYAYVTLQENNAIAKVDLTTNTLSLVKSLGAKSYASDSNNTIDIFEEGAINMKSFDGLFGLYMPDSIATYDVNGTTYLVTANEGDGREYNAHVDEVKIKNITLDSTIVANFVDDKRDMKVVKDMGDVDTDGDYDKLYAYGARSFSIWSTDGNLVYDSGDLISKKIAEVQPALFNQNNGAIDGRSGNKGGEPEALTVGAISGKTYAFVGLERQNAILIYDITNPTDVKFQSYFITETAGDISPEGMKFVPAGVSPTGKNLLLVAYEVSGSTAIYEVEVK